MAPPTPAVPPAPEPPAPVPPAPVPPAPDKKVAAPPAKKPEEKKDEKEWKGLTANSVVSSDRGCDYIVEKMLGAGGFGEVWKVSLLDDPDKRFAMKIEPTYHKKKHYLRLKCEVALFTEITLADEKIDKSHFVKMHDRGKTSIFKYYVMDLVWLSLREVKKKICGNVFTPSTIVKVARQGLEAIKALHEVGFLHRDIKPHNYAVGLPPNDNILYLLDFGISKPYKQKDGALRKPRKNVKFMGTMCYASMESLAKNEQARRDDLEMWLWMMMEIYDRHNLAWGDLEGDDVWEHIELRQEVMLHSRDMRRAGTLKCPEHWCEIIDMINEMDFETEPDYQGINRHLSLMCLDYGIIEGLPFDWAGKAPNLSERPKKPPKPKEEKKKEVAARKKKTVEEKTKEDDGKEKPAVVKKKKPVEEKSKMEVDAKEKAAVKKKKLLEEKSKEEVDAKEFKKKKVHTVDETVQDFGSDSENSLGEGSDYQTYIKWKKKRRDKRKKKAEARKKESAEKADEKNGKESKLSSKQEAEPKESRKEDEKQVKIPDVKPKLETKKEVEKKVEIPPIPPTPPTPGTPATSASPATPGTPPPPPPPQTKVAKAPAKKARRKPKGSKGSSRSPESNNSSNERERKILYGAWDGRKGGLARKKTTKSVDEKENPDKGVGKGAKKASINTQAEKPPAAKPAAPAKK